MESQGKDTNITFNPQIGLGNVLFSFKKEDVIRALGVPNEEIIDTFNKTESAIYLYYRKNIFINVSLYYENNILDYLTISSEDMILDGFRFSLFQKEVVLDFIKKYHLENDIEYLCTVDYDKIIQEECYFFENIGLTIWYENNMISDICVQKTC